MPDHVGGNAGSRRLGRVEGPQDERGHSGRVLALRTTDSCHWPSCSSVQNEPMTLEIQPLTRERLPDLAALFNQGGDPKWCGCAYYRLRGVDFSSGSALRNRRVLEGAVTSTAAEGRNPGLVAYRDGEAVGWVSVGPRDDYERLQHSKVLAPRGRQAGLVDRLLRRGALGPRRGDREGAARRCHRLRARAWRDARWRPTRSRPMANACRPRIVFKGTLGMFERAGFEVVERRRANAASAPQADRSPIRSGAAVSGASRPRSASRGPARTPPLRCGRHRHRWRPRSFPGGRRG